tara:strand:- start:1516 stop:1785 length:270 start_codon:yes stop_codon:yes gene_type:complete
MKNIIITIIFILILIVLTSIVKTSTRDLETKIFMSEEEVKLLSNKRELILLENNYLSSPDRMFELKKKFFKDNLNTINLKKIITLKNNE